MGKDYNRHFTKSANPNVQVLKLASILRNTIKVTVRTQVGKNGKGLISV